VGAALLWETHLPIDRQPNNRQQPLVVLLYFLADLRVFTKLWHAAACMSQLSSEGAKEMPVGGGGGTEINLRSPLARAVV
jgi:hypothetical protein